MGRPGGGGDGGGGPRRGHRASRSVGGAEATVPSAAIRGKQLELLGYSNFGIEPPVFVDSYRHLVELSGRGQLSIDVERFALADVGAAWAAAASGRSKAVVCPPSDGGGPT